MRSILISAFLICVFSANAQKNWELTSANGKNKLKLFLNKQGQLSYSITTHNVEVLQRSSLGILSADKEYCFSNGLIFQSVTVNKIDESYKLPTGKTSVYRNKCLEKKITFLNSYNHPISIVCRAYDDGIAFRYILKKTGDITITKEETGFHIKDKAISWLMDYNPNYENFYPERMLDTITTSHDLSYPALLHINNSVWVLFTEASVYNQPGTHLSKAAGSNNLRVASPQENFTVKNQWESPWRTFILGDKLATIVESTLVENLNPPSVIKDLSWITPGVAVFPWWGDYLANSYIDTLKKYVDMAVSMNWKWIEFDVSLVGSPWRTAKLWETTDWLPEFTAYAASKGISVYGWDEINILNSKAGRDHVFGKYKALGIKGIKIDYIDSDKDYAMRFRDTALNYAAQHKFMVSFHGETMPRGQRRKYPNLMTLEGVRGAEYYTFKGASPPSPTHNCTLPFTRNVVGPMDYTPVTFTIRDENPRITTYAHELALPFIFESGWTCMADRPAAYLNSPAKEMLKRIETTWDETKFLDGFPGKYVCLARRKGKSWYIAAINAGPERTLKIPLGFIRNGTYSIKRYEDMPGEELTNIKISNEQIKKGDMLIIKLAANGGFSTIIDNSFIP